MNETETKAEQESDTTEVAGLAKVLETITKGN